MALSKAMLGECASMLASSGIPPHGVGLLMMSFGTAIIAEHAPDKLDAAFKSIEFFRSRNKPPEEEDDFPNTGVGKR